MTEFLDEKRAEIGTRLKELKPFVAEYERLEAAAAALEGISPPSAPAGPPKRTPARAGKARRKNTDATGRGRPKGSGKRAKEALALVKTNPGITIPEIAEQMAIKQNYLYRVLPSLASEGRVKKDGRGWHPIEAA